MASAVPFLVGAYFAVLMVFVWQKLKHDKASLMEPSVASGLICGDGLWILQPPILHVFYSSTSN
ncbi:hypothetical protein RchiOBHm_Chr2g0168901 [Rosa chinensis]|uniref:Uncharacterized protein n=1 Tax=Rosa chinensis TaxID=74649 RepID=A0A2P6S4P0_ROSCH|nr:hypothetical protein RchiOBHm_Chr2g0168901 [Rosa chinensis]